MATSFNGLSRYLEKDQPELALTFNPLNTEARVRTIARALGEADRTTGGLERLRDETARALERAPVDARLYSLMGEADFQAGAEDEAFAWFELARTISKTELHALQRSIMRSVRSGELGTAVADIDILLRRWPDKAQALAPVWPQVLADEAAFQAMVSALESNPPWRTRFLHALLDDAEATVHAHRLLVSLKDGPTPPTDFELVQVISVLVHQKNFALAHRLFLLTLSEEERRLGGYVHNGSFTPLYTHRPFDWQLRDRPALQIVLPQTASPESGVVVRFLNKPVKNISFQQYLSLPPGDYRLQVRASGRTLDLPKGLSWAVRCVQPSFEIARLEFPEGSFSLQTLQTEFRVEEGCTAELLRLQTALIAESWRYRYTGTLTIHSIEIERVGS